MSTVIDTSIASRCVAEITTCIASLLVTIDRDLTFLSSDCHRAFSLNLIESSGYASCYRTTWLLCLLHDGHSIVVFAADQIVVVTLSSLNISIL